MNSTNGKAEANPMIDHPAAGAPGAPLDPHSDIKLTRDRLEAAIRAAVERMPRYYGTYIDPSDFIDDALLYALDDAVATDAVLQAEDALLKETAALRAAGAVRPPPLEELKDSRDLFAQFVAAWEKWEADEDAGFDSLIDMAGAFKNAAAAAVAEIDKLAAGDARRSPPRQCQDEDQNDPRVAPLVDCVAPQGSTASKPPGTVTAAERTERERERTLLELKLVAYALLGFDKKHKFKLRADAQACAEDIIEMVHESQTAAPSAGAGQEPPA